MVARPAVHDGRRHCKAREMNEARSADPRGTRPASEDSTTKVLDVGGADEKKKKG